MERRTFLRAGLALAAGAAGAGAGAGAAGLGGISVLPELEAKPRRSGGALRLNSNENPLGLAPAARRAVIDGIPEANRYPGSMREQLIEALAAKHGVSNESIVLGNGSTEVLQMTVQGMAAPGGRLILAEPTFEDVPWYAEPFTYRLEAVPLDSRYAHDLQRMRDRVPERSERTLVYICNPNNPTGTLTSSAEVDAWVESAPDNVYFIVDEAYYEYVDDPGYWSSVKWIETRPNVIVVRSFSKIYGMAGMRLGYGIAHPDTAARLREFIGKNNANHLALVAALASLSDLELVDRSLESNARALQITHECLAELDLEYLPTQTSFLMHRINGDLDTYRERMRERDVLVGRPFPPMLSYNRLSLGTPDEMERWADVLRSFRAKGWV